MLGVFLRIGEQFRLERSVLGDVGTARIVSTDPDRLVIDVDVKREACLVVADTEYPGWRAFVDGKERRIQRANVAFRAVALKRGDQRVEFVYEPKSVLLGGIGSALSALLALALTFGVGRRWLTVET